MFDVFKEAKGIRIGQWSVLSKSFAIVTALHIMEASSIAAIVARIDAALFIDFTAERITSAFREDFIDLLFGMVTPDQLTQRPNWRICAARLFNSSGHRAALPSIEPSIRTKPQTVDDRMRVLNSKAFEQNLWVAIGNVVMIGVWIEQQIRRIGHVDSTASDRERRRNIQLIHENVVLVVDSVSIRIFMDADTIRALEMVRGRRRNFVVDGS